MKNNKKVLLKSDLSCLPLKEEFQYIITEASKLPSNFEMLDNYNNDNIFKFAVIADNCADFLYNNHIISKARYNAYKKVSLYSKTFNMACILAVYNSNTSDEYDKSDLHNYLYIMSEGLLSISKLIKYYSIKQSRVYYFDNNVLSCKTKKLDK